MLKMRNKILILLVALILQGCAVSTLHHDAFNPCLKGPFQNGIECNEWKEKYPKEYQRYLKRIEKYKKNGKMEKINQYYKDIEEIEKDL